MSLLAFHDINHKELMFLAFFNSAVIAGFFFQLSPFLEQILFI